MSLRLFFHPDLVLTGAQAAGLPVADLGEASNTGLWLLPS